MSCGCSKGAAISAKKSTHGMRHSPEYGVWSSIVTRCKNPRYALYRDYGGRGIEICSRWADFSMFYADMGPRPSPEHSIERRDNDGDYEPGNCYWATRLVQANNKRNNHVLEAFGRKQTLSQWARDFSISPSVIGKRLRRGWDAERAISTPIPQNRLLFKPNDATPAGASK